MEKFQAVLNLHHKHQSALGYSLVTLLTVGTERIFSTAVFQCPCTASWNLLYGLVFLLVPALALFLLGYVLNARTWRLLTGCCARDACKGCCAPGVCAAQRSGRSRASHLGGSSAARGHLLRVRGQRKQSNGAAHVPRE